MASSIALIFASESLAAGCCCHFLIQSLYMDNPVYNFLMFFPMPLRMVVIFAIMRRWPGC